MSPPPPPQSHFLPALASRCALPCPCAPTLQDAETIAATRELVFGKYIPAAIASLEEDPTQSVTAVLHQHGVCCYWLGVVAHLCSSSGSQNALKAVHTELIARSFKTFLYLALNQRERGSEVCRSWLLWLVHFFLFCCGLMSVPLSLSLSLSVCWCLGILFFLNFSDFFEHNYLNNFWHFLIFCIF